MKYEVGDRVKIREDLIGGENYGSINFVKPMEEYKGQITEITMTYDDGEDGYLIDIDGGMWYWTDEMFEEQEVDNNEQARTVDVGFHLDHCGHRVIKSDKRMTRVEMVQRLIIDIDTDSELLELIKTNPKWELIGVRRWNSKDNKFHELTFENVVTTTDTSLVKIQLLADKEIED